jgi:hypothetical protein
LALPPELWGIAAVLAIACTVLPVLLVAEALKRIGANHFALIGALGPSPRCSPISPCSTGTQRGADCRRCSGDLWVFWSR